MKNKFILSVALMITAISCSKTPNQLFELSNENLEIDNIDQAIVNLDKIVKNYPKDSLASKAQYKIASIYLNWKNDLNNGFIQLQNTAINYNNSIQGEQAQSEIDQFPEYIINKAESLRKRKMLKEAVDHLMYMTDKYPVHELTPKAQYMLGDVYMNDFRDFSTAIQEYRKVLETYSGSSQEPHALFMIGYIYANILKDNRSAEVEYRAFMEQFPNHELYPSVKFELEFLGKSIEEIPALKHITT
jgi:TolA-binding protein